MRQLCGATFVVNLHYTLGEATRVATRPEERLFAKTPKYPERPLGKRLRPNARGGRGQLDFAHLLSCAIGAQGVCVCVCVRERFAKPVLTNSFDCGLSLS